MAVGYLNERTRKMINMVTMRSSAFSIKEAAEELSVSTRTVYNELERMNDWLQMKRLPEVQVIRGKIQIFTDQEKRLVEENMQQEAMQEDYIFKPSERICIIICQIIAAEEPVYIEDMMDVCHVSRNTIFTDLQGVITRLYTYRLGLEYEKKEGYWISGNSIKIRALFFLYFNMLDTLISQGRIKYLHREVIEKNFKRLEAVEQELNVSYVKNDMLALAAMLPVMERGEQKLKFSDVSVKRVKMSREYHATEQHFPELSDMEKVYLTLHFLGGRLTSYSEQKAENDTVLKELAGNLVTEFERTACVLFDQREELIQELYQHIRGSIYRYRFGIQIGSPIADDIKREYPYIFDAMRATVRYLEQQIRVQISDSEVAYLSLHFGAHLEHARHDEKELRILVVCMNGVATGNMISHELARILPWAKIVGVMAASKIVNPQNICDIIITSAKLTAVVPVIVVNPILNDFDRRNILNHPLIRNRFGFVDTDALFRLVQKYVPEERQSDLKRDLDKFFAGNQENHQPLLNPDVWRLTDFLTEDRIIFLDSDGCRKGISEVSEDGRRPWERAIYTVGQPLLVRRSMGEEYIRCIIDRLVEAGPYMFVTKDLILAHARPDNDVKHLDLAIGIAPDGIEFQDGKVARIVFMLVVEDQEKHMGILKDIRKALAKKEQVDELMTVQTAEEACRLLQSKLGSV